MNTQDQRNELCRDLAEQFTALPKPTAPAQRGSNWRELLLDLIGDKLVRLRELGVEWR